MTSEFATNLLKVYNAIINVLATKVNISDIKDNLTSTDVNKPLSAKQGKLLNDELSGKASNNHVHGLSEITNLQSSLNEKANTNHTQASSTITDLTTASITITYDDNSTETLTLFVHDNS